MNISRAKAHAQQHESTVLNLKQTLRVCSENAHHLKSLVGALAVHVRRDEVAPREESNECIKRRRLLLMDHTLGASKSGFKVCEAQAAGIPCRVI